MNHSQVLFRLLNTQICSTDVNLWEESNLNAETIAWIYALAHRHDLAHLVGHALSELGMLGSDEVSKKFKQQALQAVYRQVRMESACQQSYQLFEKHKIPFIPLKGAVLRAYYPEPWMRTSCDVDILVKEEDLDRAIDLLQEQLKYTAGGKGDHDVSLYSPQGIHLELHYDTIQERYAVNGCRDVLTGIWEDATSKAPGSYHYCMSDAMFYFYHIAHMVKHFTTGGCGIRSFLDIWIMNHRMEFDKEKRHALLQEGGLLQFAQAAERLSEVWFSGAPADELSEQMSDYILRAGLYGDHANRAAVGQAKMGGKLRYLLSRRVFMPYEFLKAEYPVLQKHKWLMPWYQIVRWARMLCSGGLGRALRELKANAGTNKEKQASAADMLKQIGL